MIGVGTAGHSARLAPMPSTVIQFFDYDASKRELLIEFRSGRRYVYEDVPDDAHTGLRRSFSKGEYFNEHIRDRYAFRRVDS